MNLVKKTLGISAILVAMLFAAPIVAFAQSEQHDLRIAIEGSIFADPRVAGIPPSELQGLVDALVQQAQVQNMSVSDILWQPGIAEAATIGGTDAVAANAECAAGYEGYLCQFNRVFGFEGGNYEMPIILLVTSGLLAVIIWEIRAHHKKNMAKMAKKASAAAPPAQKMAR
jgi:hypothetical protein